MHFELTPTQKDLFARYAQLGRTVASRAAEHDAHRSFDRQSWDRISAEGLWRLPIPAEWGGFGGSWQDCVVAMEGVAQTADDLGFLVTMLGHIGSLRVMHEEGTAEQKRRWLEPLMRGAVGITAMTEETGGSDLARMQLAATPSGQGWSLSGRKVHITNAPVASVGMVAGRIPSLGPKKDITLFFVDLDADGIRLGAPEDNLGIRTSPTADIDFDGLHLDPVNIIGRPGDGLRILYRIISFERALYGIMASGTIESMLRKSMDRAEKRFAFNKPIADNQHVQRRLTDMKISATLTRMMTYASLHKIEQESPDASIDCSITKFIAGERVLESAENLVQLHGHLGFMNNDLSRTLRDAVGMRIAGGTSDIQRINIFNQMRRLHRNREVPPAPVAIAAE